MFNFRIRKLTKRPAVSTRDRLTSPTSAVSCSVGSEALRVVCAKHVPFPSSPHFSTTSTLHIFDQPPFPHRHAGVTRQSSRLLQSCLQVLHRPLSVSLFLVGGFVTYRIVRFGATSFVTSSLSQYLLALFVFLRIYLHCTLDRRITLLTLVSFSYFIFLKRLRAPAIASTYFWDSVYDHLAVVQLVHTFVDL